MKYHVAMIVSVLAAALLIGGAYVQTRQAEQKTSALRANLSAQSIQQLTARYWECQPHSPGEPYKRDAAYCAEVNKVMERRETEVPALQVVKIRREILLPLPICYGHPCEPLLQTTTPRG
jgi:type II secretory pathway pseudopilin PulG